MLNIDDGESREKDFKRYTQSSKS